jgi:tetratricopeptide (TPR) repeat protein
VTPVESGKSLEEKFGRYREWNSLLAVNGPIDDAGLCLRLGQSFSSQSLFRQAALQFTRTLQLQPDNLDARFWLAEVFLAGQIPDKALEVAAEIRARQSGRPLSSTNLVELVRIEAMAHFNRGDTDTAEKLLSEARRQFPQDEVLLDARAQMYVTANRLTNALETVEEQLKIKPDNVTALLNKAYICLRLESYDLANAAVTAVLKKEPDNVQALLDKGVICIQTKAFKEAVAPLNQALKLQPNNQIALLNRAIAQLQSDQLDAAQRDYEALQKVIPSLHQAYYGLGEIAFRRKDVPAAIQHCEAYLKYAPPGTDEAKQIAERLKHLKTATDR